MSAIARLAQAKGYQLPQAPQPVGNYLATIEQNELLFISGQLPLENGQLHYQGCVGRDLTLEQGKQAAHLCALNLLSQIDSALDASGKSLDKILKLDGFICTAPEFSRHAEVLNGASDLLAEVLGEHAGHIRTVLGCDSLPINAAVEISAIVALKNSASE